MTQLSLDAFLSYKFLSGLQFSPDGQQAALVVSRCDAEENGYQANIWLWRNGSFMQLTALDREFSFVWEDSTHILFPAVRSSSEKKRSDAGEPFTVFYRISTEGGEAVPAFELPFSASGLKAAGGGRWLVTGTIDAAQPDAYLLTGTEREACLKAQKDAEDYEVLTEIPYYANGGGYTAGKRTALFLYDPQNDTLRRLSDPQCDVGQAVILGSDVYFTGTRREGRTSYRDSDVFHVTLPDGDPVQITHGEMTFSALEILDGRLLAAASEKAAYRITADENFYWLDPATGSCTLLAESSGSPGNLVSTDCHYGRTRTCKSAAGALYLIQTVRNAAGLYKLTPDGVCTPVYTREGSVDDFDVTEDGRILFSAMYDSRPEELYELRDGRAVRRSSFHDALLDDVYIAQPQKLTVLSQGTDIDGWVLLPKDFDPEKTYPAILDIHGGPRVVYGEVFFHEMQYWANCGYFVFFCNPAGGGGRGLAFADICGQYGGIDYQNLMDFTDAVLARWPQIDPQRLGCTGGSYGGFMSNWILGHTDRFAAIATQRSISNWISFYGTSDIGFDFASAQLGADIYTPEGLQAMWNQSPLKYAGQMHTPTLILHSTEDYRCPYEQGLQLFTALKDRGIPARMCCFHGENHELSRSGRPQHRIRRLQEITDWMEQWLKA